MAGLMVKVAGFWMIVMMVAACSDATKMVTYPMSSGAALQLTVPDSWEEVQPELLAQTPPVLAFTTKNRNGLELMFTSGASTQKTLAMPNDIELKSRLETSIGAAAGHVVEQSLSIRELKGGQATGYYFVATDKVSTAGKYRNLAQGVFRTGDVVSFFTVRTNDASGKTLEQALAVLKNVTYLGAGTAGNEVATNFSDSPAAAPDFVMADGGRYYGPMVAGKFHGKGMLIWPNGARYEGEFKRGLMEGKGKYQSVSYVYEGDFREGMKHGYGRYKEHDRVLYVGEFVNELFHGNGRYEAEDAVYEGQFSDGYFDGIGTWSADGETYRGAFRRGKFAGQGELQYADGRRYTGSFENGLFHGAGRYETPDKQIYEGNFEKGEFAGQGSLQRADGARYSGSFRQWRPEGIGSFTDAAGNVYEGSFVNGELAGKGRMIARDGSRYEGDFKGWHYHGQGTFQYANGDEYVGEFAYGLFDGEGVFSYAKPDATGRVRDAGTWRDGVLDDKKAAKLSRAQVEAALYGQRTLLDKALAGIAPSEPGKIDLYLLAVGGDGAQEVFRREVEFVRNQFDRNFGTGGRSLVLVNSRNTVTSMPMATVTSIRESVSTIARQMDKENDILFLFLTSHGSRDHQLMLDQNGMDLSDLEAAELAKILKESGIRWKVVVVSACYSGGFIDPLKDRYTMIITAARHDRTSFGCEDQNDFTYFGKAFFKESVPTTKSFADAFQKAKALVTQWEAEDARKAGTRQTSEHHSEPQMHRSPLIEQHLKKWRAQLQSTSVKEGKQDAPVVATAK